MPLCRPGDRGSPGSARRSSFWVRRCSGQYGRACAMRGGGHARRPARLRPDQAGPAAHSSITANPARGSMHCPPSRLPPPEPLLLHLHIYSSGASLRPLSRLPLPQPCCPLPPLGPQLTLVLFKSCDLSISQSVTHAAAPGLRATMSQAILPCHSAKERQPSLVPLFFFGREASYTGLILARTAGISCKPASIRVLHISGQRQCPPYVAMHLFVTPLPCCGGKRANRGRAS